MSKLPITAVMSAMTAAAKAMSEEESAREDYDGYSWGYHGASYIKAVEDETAAAEAALETYIQQRVQEAINEWIANRVDANS